MLSLRSVVRGTATYNLSRVAVNAGIISFGGMKVVSWKSDVRLHCRFVGIPEPSQEWRASKLLYSLKISFYDKTVNISPIF